MAGGTPSSDGRVRAYGPNTMFSLAHLNIGFSSNIGLQVAFFIFSACSLLLSNSHERPMPLEVFSVSL